MRLPELLERAEAERLLRQYLYFCTSKASKLSTCRKLRPSANKRVPSPSPSVDTRSAVNEEHRVIRWPAKGAAHSWQISLLAKSKPIAISPLAPTPSGGGLLMRAGIIGVSIVSCSMSLSNAKDTKSTITRSRQVPALGLISPQPPHFASDFILPAPPSPPRSCRRSGKDRLWNFGMNDLTPCHTGRCMHAETPCCRIDSVL